jgi:hypothetical protein
MLTSALKVTAIAPWAAVAVPISVVGMNSNKIKCLSYQVY